MDDFKQDLKILLVRILIAGLLISAGFILLSSLEREFSSIPWILAAMAFFVIGAFIVSPSVAKLIATPLVSVFYPSRTTEIIPMYGIADSLLKKGFYEDAFKEYKKIAEKYPDELSPYNEMIKIAHEHLKDNNLAREIYDLGVSNIKDKDKKEKLSYVFHKDENKEDNKLMLNAFENAIKKIKR